jgi:hypothetical protein
MPLGARIRVTFHRTVAVEYELAVMMSPFGVLSTSIDSSGNRTSQVGQYGQLDNYQTTFMWVQGADPNEVDPGALSSVTLDFLALPQKADDFVSVRIDMVFVDGGVLDFIASARLESVSFSCPAIDGSAG